MQIKPNGIITEIQEQNAKPKKDEKGTMRDTKAIPWIVKALHQKSRPPKQIRMKLTQWTLTISFGYRTKKMQTLVMQPQQRLTMSYSPIHKNNTNLPLPAIVIKPLNTNIRFEDEESAVLPSLPQVGARLVRGTVRDSIPQPVDGESSSATYDHRTSDIKKKEITGPYCCIKKTNYVNPPTTPQTNNGKGSVNPRLFPALTLIRDVPHTRDDPLTAVSAGGLFPQATTITNGDKGNALPRQFMNYKAIKRAQDTNRESCETQEERCKETSTTCRRTEKTTSTNNDHRNDDPTTVQQSNNGKGSVDPRLFPALTLTRDVPHTRDDPLAAVSAGGLSPQASRHNVQPKSTIPSTTLLPSVSTNKDDFGCAPTSSSMNDDECRPNPALTSNTINTNPKHEKTIAIQWNVNGIQERYAELQLITEDYHPAVIALQETRITKTEILKRFHHAEYQWQIRPGPSSRSQNGVGLAVHNNAF